MLGLEPAAQRESELISIDHEQGGIMPLVAGALGH